jgi:hypothetical protein
MYFTHKLLVSSIVGISATLLSVSGGIAAEVHEQAALVSAEISTIARHLSLRPKTAIDFSAVSDEYCYFTGWDTHHTHFAINPEGTEEDNVDFVDARPLIEAGIAVQDLPALPEGLGNMVPGQWYLVA